MADCISSGCIGGEGRATEIPEFPTVAIPAMLALSGYLLIRRRRRE